MTTTEPTPTTFELLPLDVRVRGEVITSNVAEFCAGVRRGLNQLNRKLQTDEDFGTAKDQVKTLKSAEKAIANAQERILEQARDINVQIRELAAAGDEVSHVRRDFEKLIEAREQAIRAELVLEAVARIRHPKRARFERDAREAAKGKRTVATTRAALEQFTDRINRMIDDNRARLDAFEAAHGADLIADRLDLEIEEPAVVEQRLDQRVEAKRLRLEREKLESQKREQEAQARLAAQKLAPKPDPLPASPPEASPPPATPVSAAPTLPDQAAEWDWYKTTLFASLAGARDARAKLQHPLNQRRAEQFRLGVIELWEKVNQIG